MSTKMKRMNRKEVTGNQLKYEKQKSRRMGEEKCAKDKVNQGKARREIFSLSPSLTV